MTIKSLSPAKINLGLSIIKKLPNNYHEVKTIYTQVNLFDELTIKDIQDNKIKIVCNDADIPCDESNTVYKAAALIKKRANISSGVEIYIKKNIPSGSGLGGGSSNAASTLISLNKMWKLNLPLSKLIIMAKKIGADVPFHLIGGTALEIQGGDKGGEVEQLPPIPNCFIIVCVPKHKILCKNAYSNVQYDKIGKNNLNSLIDAIKKKNLRKLCNNLHNDFELWTLKQYPVLKQIKQEMKSGCALGNLLTGKGSGIYGIFDNITSAKKTYKLLKLKHAQCYLLKNI